MKRLIFLVALLGVGCGISASDDASDWNQNAGYPDASTWQCTFSNDCPQGYYCNEFHRCVPLQTDGGVGDGGTLPPETEQEYSPPASGERYVYVALTHQDTVARIDSESLDVGTIGVGDWPTVLATAPGQDLAVVLNWASESVSVLRTEQGVDQVTTLPTPPHFNRLVMGPLGGHAVAYFELDDPQAQGVGSFQDVSVIDLTPGLERVVNVSVGFRPRQVIFAPDESFAYVITEDGVSILDLAVLDVGYFATTVPLSPPGSGEGDPDEVVITPDGRLALARWAGLSGVRAVDLDTGDLTDTALAGPPTDLDLTPSGDRLLAVVRSRAELALLDIPDDIGDATAVETIDCTPLLVGSATLSADGSRALVYSNAVTEKAITLVDLDTGDVQTRTLRKGVRWVAISPDGQTALVLHNKVPGDPQPDDDFETQLDKRYGFSLFDLDSLFVKLQITEADPGSFTFSVDGRMAYVIVADPQTGLREVAVLDLTSFIVDAVTLGSHPSQIGTVVGTDRIYVSQEHALGRVSFIDVATGQLRTVTGFQLNSQVIE